MQTNNITHQNIINRVANNVCDSFSNKTIKYGNQLNIKTFDLMTGLAGIGYQLLRIANPDLVPSVLTLQKPTK
jgi:lantibiotic modifying enzyme